MKRIGRRDQQPIEALPNIPYLGSRMLISSPCEGGYLPVKLEGETKDKRGESKLIPMDRRIILSAFSASAKSMVYVSRSLRVTSRCRQES